MHMCISKIIIIGSDNGLSPRQSQAIFWISAGILLIQPKKIQWNLNPNPYIIFIVMIQGYVYLLQLVAG